MLAISQYETLFSLIGTTYGGDGVNNFALPDLRGAVAVGAGAGPGLSSYAPGQTGGSETVALTGSQVPVHTHAMGATSASGSTNVPGTTVIPGTSSVPLPYSPSAPDTAMASGAITPNTGGQPHANLQPVLCINYIIATDGIYPSQN